MLLDIVILPPPQLREKIGKYIFSAAKPYAYRYLVDNKNLIPHLSLFHLRTSKARLKKLTAKMSAIIQDYRPVKIVSKGFSFHNRTVVYKLSNNATLRRLNLEVVKQCHPLRTGQMPPWSGSGQFSAIEGRHRQEYGTQHNIGKSFKPHFTLVGFTKQADVADFVRKTQPQKFQFHGDTIAICQVNTDYQVTKILKRLKLR